MTINSKLKSLVNKYYINILSDSKRFVKRRPVQYYFSASDDKDICTGTGHYETEPLLTVDIPLSSLEAIADIESTFYNNIDDVQRRRHFEEIMRQQSNERYLRNKYPAVREAYEQYSLMLHLCSENQIKPK